MDEKIIKTRKDIIEYIKSEVLMNFQFFDLSTPVSDYESCKVENTCTTSSIDEDGIYYNTDFLFDEFKQYKATRNFMHMLLHKVYLHYVSEADLDKRLWNLACDIAVENTLNEFDMDFIKSGKETRQNKIIEDLKSRGVLITAENMYHYFIKNVLSEHTLRNMEDAFHSDDHSIWYIAGDGIMGSMRCQSSKSLQEESKKTLEAMKFFGNGMGDKAGSLIENIEQVNREKYDYTEFLKKFAVSNEVMKVNQDEFDYIYYTVGMNLFPKKRMPFIEPLEYKEVKQVKEFVIVIDTSGSVHGKLVQLFLTKTYNILMQENSFSKKVNIHIIQCDADIQEHVKITCIDELKEYISTMKLKGFGGTDFRPAFSLVNKMVKEKEFQNLKGLIYFTDGFGIFPTVQPSYKTVFVYLDMKRSVNNYDVPPWAMKLILREEDFEC